MSDLDKEIQHLKERTAQNRRQFLRTEVNTCFLILEMAVLEESAGNVEFARKELATADRGIATIERFLAEAPEQASEIMPKLAELKALLASLRSEPPLREQSQ